MLYTYAILLKSAVTFPSLVGISGQPIWGIANRELMAVVETGVDVDSLRQLPEPDLIRAIVTHDQIICSLFASYTLLPLRFGTSFISESAIIDYLQANQKSLLSRLTFLGGLAEYCLRFTAKPKVASQLPEPSGKSYLLAKKSEYRLQEQYGLLLNQSRTAWLDTLAKWFNDRQIPYQLKTEPDMQYILLLTIAQWDELTSYLSATALEQNFCLWSWQISPPTPPYHFTDWQTDHRSEA